jgi:hypothetical protein
MKLTQDTVTKLALLPGQSERIVWDSDIPGLGIRLRPHSVTQRWPGFLPVRSPVLGRVAVPRMDRDGHNARCLRWSWPGFPR